MYSEIARGYDELYFEEQREKALVLIEEIGNYKTLLDIGCGTGKVTALFPGKKYGIEPCFAMVQQAKFPVVQGVAEQLPFKDKSFDVVISLTAFHHFSLPQDALKEMRRVGNRIAITLLKRCKKYDELRKFILSNGDYKIIEQEKDTIFVQKHTG